MAKNWWFKFEFRVWRTDPSLRRCSLETRGFWLDALCVMHEMDEPELSGTYEEIGRLIGCESAEVGRCVVELQRTKTADVTLGNGNVTLSSRRLKREASVRKQTRLRVQKHREQADVTPSQHNRVISKSKSKELREEEEATIAAKKLTDSEWLESLGSNAAYKLLDVQTEYARAQVWAEANRRQCTRRFFVNWLNRAKPMDVQTNGKPRTEREKSSDRAINGERIALALERGDEATLRNIFSDDISDHIKGYLPS